MTSSPPRSRAIALVAHLEDLAAREDRGAVAALRRGLGKEPGTVPEMYRHVEPFLQSAGPRETEAAYLVASLFGLHPVAWTRPEDSPWNTSFGWSLRPIRSRDDGMEQREDEGVARRFVAALTCDRPALGTHLRQLLSILHFRKDSAPVDWERLYRDIVNWEDADRRVRRRWAEGFWRGTRPEHADDAIQEPDSQEEAG